MAVPNGFSFVLWLSQSLMISRWWMVPSGLGRCCLGLWRSCWAASTDYEDYFRQLYGTNDKYSCSSYKQQETLNLLNPPWTVENLLSWITPSEEAKCKVLPCITHRSLQVASENFPGSPMASEGCSEGRDTFFFGHGGNLFLLIPGKEDLGVFDRYFLLTVCVLHFLAHFSFPLLSSKAGSWFNSVFSLLMRSFEVCKFWDYFLPCLLFCLPSLLVGMGRQGISHKEVEKESCDWIFSATWKEIPAHFSPLLFLLPRFF